MKEEIEVIMIRGNKEDKRIWKKKGKQERNVMHKFKIRILYRAVLRMISSSMKHYVFYLYNLQFILVQSITEYRHP